MPPAEKSKIVTAFNNLSEGNFSKIFGDKHGKFVKAAATFIPPLMITWAIAVGVGKIATFMYNGLRTRTAEEAKTIFGVVNKLVEKCPQKIAPEVIKVFIKEANSQLTTTQKQDLAIGINTAIGKREDAAAIKAVVADVMPGGRYNASRGDVSHGGLER